MEPSEILFRSKHRSVPLCNLKTKSDQKNICQNQTEKIIKIEPKEHVSNQTEKKSNQKNMCQTRPKKKSNQKNMCQTRLKKKSNQKNMCQTRPKKYFLPVRPFEVWRVIRLIQN